MLQETQMEHWSGTQWMLHGDPVIAGRSPELFIPAYGVLRSKGGFRWHQRPCQTVALHFIEEGAGVFESDAVRREAGKGDVVAIFPGQWVEYRDFRDSPWRYRWVHLEGERAEEVVGACGLTRESPLRARPVSIFQRRLFEAIERELSGADPSGAAAAEFGWRLVRSLEDAGRRIPQSLARRARFLIDHHFGSRLGVMEIAEELGVSRSTLFREFQREFGCSPKVFLDRRRMELAERLLLETGMSVKEVAFDAGFSGEAYFSRAFRLEHGMPPMRWRRENGRECGPDSSPCA